MSKKLDHENLASFVKALAFASRKHSQQRRKDVDASPYINHPIALVSILAVEAGINDCDTLCAALLHDTIEDTDTSVEELVETFGAPVASLVQELTDDKRLPKAERKLLQVEHAEHLSSKACSVKLADKIANLREVADSPPRTGRSNVGKNISIGRSKLSTESPILHQTYFLYLWPPMVGDLEFGGVGNGLNIHLLG